eukprot:9857193-Alexandrium_andersonii.AAC.1
MSCAAGGPTVGAPSAKQAMRLPPKWPMTDRAARWSTVGRKRTASAAVALLSWRKRACCMSNASSPQRWA